MLDKILLDTIVEPEDALSLSEIEFMKFRQAIWTGFSKILERKAGLLAKLEKITDYETLLQRLGSYFIKMAQEINNLVSEIRKKEQTLGPEAAKEFIEKIQNSLYLDPEKNGDLIDKLQSLPETYLEDNIVRFQLALILDGGKKLKDFKKRVQAALIHNDDKELKGLIEEISDKLRRSAYYQAILISEGRNKLEQFKERVQAALKRNNYEELEDLVEEISALKIMQVYPFSSSTIISERKACELRVEYDQLRSSAHYQAILILEGGNTLEQFRRRVQAALKRNNYEELEDLVEEISALKIMKVYPFSSSTIISERKACELKAEYQRMTEEALGKLRLRKLRSST